MTAKAIPTVIVALLLLACGGGDGANKRGSVPSPQQIQNQAPLEILASATGAARAKGSAHVISVARLGNETFRIEGDIGSDRGIQIVTVGDARSEIHFVEGIAYVLSNKNALTRLYGFSPEVASRYAQKWLAFSSSDQLYSRISRGLTIDNMIQDIAVAAPLTKTSLRLIGRVQTIGVTGKTAEGDSATLYVALKPDPLPVQMIITRDQETAMIDFSEWGNPVSVTAPSNATRAAELAT